jgi:hypothetical protein
MRVVPPLMIAGAALALIASPVVGQRPDDQILPRSTALLKQGETHLAADAVSVLVKVRLLVKVIKVKMLVPAVVSVLDSRVVKHLYSVVYQNVVLQISAVKNTQL